MARKAAIVAVIVILVAFAALWLLLPQIQSGGIQATVGKVGIPIGIVVALWQLVKSLFPEGTKLFVASILRKIGYLPVELKRTVVRNEVEGNINRAVKEFGCEGSRLLPHPASVEWVSTGEISPDSFFRDGRVIIKLDYSENPHRNIVEGGILYCKAGLVPETRRYLSDPFRRGLDLVFVQAVLERNDLREGLLYFAQEVAQRKLDENPDVKKHYDRFYELHEHGYFTRILLPELRDYAGRVHIADTKKQHHGWIENFVDFLMEIAKERPRESRGVLDHIGKRFRVSVIIIGIAKRLAIEGQRPYIKRTAKCAQQGARTVFLIGPSNSILDIAKNAVRLTIADSSTCDSYHVTWHGSVRRAWCARLEISEQTAALALDRVEGIEYWPDLEAIAETDAE
jgi:hypothetical protein